MEKIPKYIFLILLLFVFQNTQAQDASVHPTNNPDPKLAAERNRLETSTSINPAKPATPLMDQKLDLVNSGSTVAKPQVVNLIDPKLEAEVATAHPMEIIPAIRTENKAAIAPSKESNEQPAGIVSKSNTNYRNIKGPDSQPAGAKPEKVTDFRKMNGPNTQPAGDKPKR